MSDVDLLESVLDKDARLIACVTPEQLGGPTQCPDYDVKTLVLHMTGWARAFAASATERESREDPGAYDSADPATDFRAAADEIVGAWRERGTDRSVRFMSSELPGDGIVAMTLMEYVTHGLDLALATDQPVPFSDEELETTLARAQVSLPDQYRGEGKPFADRVEVPDDAPAAARLLGFMGRQPA